jgi:hypothetical protein
VGRVVVAAEDAQRGQSVANARVLALVLGKQRLLDCGAALLEHQGCREELAFLAGEMRLQLASNLDECSLEVA